MKLSLLLAPNWTTCLASQISHLLTHHLTSMTTHSVSSVTSSTIEYLCDYANVRGKRSPLELEEGECNNGTEWRGRPTRTIRTAAAADSLMTQFCCCCCSRHFGRFNFKLAGIAAKCVIIALVYPAFLSLMCNVLLA